MRRAHRTAHVRLWTLLFFLLIITIGVALNARQTMPVEDWIPPAPDTGPQGEGSPS